MLASPFVGARLALPPVGQNNHHSPSGWPGRGKSRPDDLDDPVKMVRHDHKLIQDHPGESAGDVSPRPSHNLPCLVQIHLAVIHITKQMPLVLDADRHEIPSRPRVIVSPETDRAAMMGFRIVGHPRGLYRTSRGDACIALCRGTACRALRRRNNQNCPGARCGRGKPRPYNGLGRFANRPFPIGHRQVPTISRLGFRDCFSSRRGTITSSTDAHSEDLWAACS